MNDTTVLCGSHIPVLVRLMQYVDKPVLELGIGWNSTPLLHWLCKEKSLPLFSFESDYKWMKNFLNFSTENHSILQTDFLDIHDLWSGYGIRQLGLVLVDHRPARKRRSSALYFADKADFVVLHDSELSDHPAYKYTPIYGNFKYKYEYKSVGKPYTMILSNTIDVERILT